MFKKNIFVKVILCFLFIILLNFSSNSIFVNADEKEVYLGGFPAGFILNTTTVEVVGVCDVMTENGMQSPARECGIKSGDIINKINGLEIKSTNDVNVAVADDYKSINIEVIRKSESLSFQTNAVIDVTNGKKRLGLLVKDSINGIGTVTFVDKDNNKFASLGHPVLNEKNNLQEINGGSIYGCYVYEIKKGIKGTPGELRGIFENNKILGKVVKNSYCGVYGELETKTNFNDLEKIKTANINEAKMGKAYIYTTINGKDKKRYEISIVKIDENNRENRNFVIKIDDNQLIEKTGGIVQGMSGSPIVQNGKLIGAVTHVFVNDPTRGYGISIEKMINQ